jgi:SAM-dependent methyltransferase
MIEWLSSIDAVERRFAELSVLAREDQERTYRTGALAGWCACCQRDTTFRLPRGDGWINLRESLLCECGMNGRMRMIMGALRAEPPQPPFLMFERVTPLYALVAREFPFVQGCEYFGPEAVGGSEHDFRGLPVRHEDMQSLSVPDGSMRTLFHGDVLEHVADPQRALAECRRVLAPGGTLLFTCPVLNRRAHEVRARVEGGQLVHLQPPAYHGNPLDDSGTLVFTEPGLSLLEDLRHAGFDRAEIGLAYDASQGILRDGNPWDDYNMWPVLFRARRNT